MMHQKLQPRLPSTFCAINRSKSIASRKSRVLRGHFDEWKLVYSALSSRDWDFRTVEGISRETRLPVARVKKILIDYADEVRLSMVRSEDNHKLYAIKTKKVTLREIFAAIKEVI